MLLNIEEVPNAPNSNNLEVFDNLAPTKYETPYPQCDNSSLFEVGCAYGLS